MVKTGAENVTDALVYVPAGSVNEPRNAVSLCKRVRSTGYTVGVKVREIGAPAEGFKVIPVIPTLADITDMFVNEVEGVDVMVSAILAFPPPPPPLPLGTPLHPATAMIDTERTKPSALLHFIPHPVCMCLL